MSETPSHLPARPSLEQLRKQAKERLRELRAADPAAALAGAQYALARDYGFPSWPKLVQHVESVRAGTTPPFYRIAADGKTIELRPPPSEADWDTIFAVMTERGLTGIRTAAIADRALERLARLDFVTSLEIDGAALSDDGLLRLARMPQLEELSVSGQLTDRGFAVLRDLPRLRRLAICWMQGVTDAGMANLTFCDQLECVDLMGTPTGDGALEALRGKRRLHDLRTGRLVTDAGLELLHDLPMFKTTREREPTYDLMTFAPDGNNLLLDGPFTDRGLASLGGLDGVFGLGFFRHAHAFTGAGLRALAGLPNLRFLGCPGDRCDDEAMRSIASLPDLRMLMAQGTVASDDGFAALSRCPTLEYLWGRECPNLRGRGFRALATMPCLRGLGVSCKHVDDAALAALPEFPALTQLMPMDVPDDGFRHVGACRRLTDLWCMYCRETGDRATEHIAGLELKTYYAGKTRITDRSCGLLGRMASLESIEFWEIAGVTDAGLAALAMLPRLRRFTIAGSAHVTRQGLAPFPARVRVDWS